MLVYAFSYPSCGIAFGTQGVVFLLPGILQTSLELRLGRSLGVLEIMGSERKRRERPLWRIMGLC